ncbi:MAG: cyclic nucleotide-binding domain-containing protein [Candidatus Delongbacteria bacterium]|nr:cyclic nucleotide-binding domain-containing protein [Candidatus Delongbacteria bacterium]
MVEHRADIVQCLIGMRIFGFMADDLSRLERILPLLNLRHYRSGETVIEEGAVGDSLFIVLSGRVRIVKHTSDQDAYTVIILEEKDHGFFGEICLLQNSRRTASVVCEEDSSFLELRRRDFEQLCHIDPYLGMMIYREIAKILAERLRKTDEDVITLFNALVSEVEGNT